MKDLTAATKFYLLFVYALGGVFFAYNILKWPVGNLLMLAALCTLASLALIIKVEGSTSRSHYTFSFIFYGFAFIHLGVAGALIVIIVSNLVEWIVNRPAWYIQVFNTTCYIFVISMADFVYKWVASDSSITTLVSVLAIIISMLVFTMLNHVMVGIIVWMARGENFKESGVFEFMPIVIDLTLLTLGTMLALVWETNPYALLLFIFPMYLLYSTLRVPALERQTITDQKTGLFNHRYFMQNFENELERADRFDRPLTVIMADLDLLRNINNTYGHIAGDEVLIAMADILRKSVREYDVVARFGGEEFSILMPETELKQAFERAEEIRQAVEKAEFTISTSVTPIRVTLSLGVAHRDGFHQTPQSIIHNADTALYHSKLKGRNRAYAYSKEAYEDFAFEYSGVQKLHRQETTTEMNSDIDPESTPLNLQYQAANARMVQDSDKSLTTQATEIKEPMIQSAEGGKTSKFAVHLFIGGVFILACLLFGGLYFLAPSFYAINTMQSWIGILICAVIVIVTERYSIELYTKNTSLSISAAPILVGTLLFGPTALLILSATYAIITGLIYHSPLSRIVFNFSNQLLAGMLYNMFILSSGQPFVEWSSLTQLIFAILSAVTVFFLNTSLITIGIHLDKGQPAISFWKEQYSWLFPIYISIGVIAAAVVFGYKHDPFIGPVLAIVPLLVLRYSQVQHVIRTQVMVRELRQKNTILEHNSEEINKLNTGLLETLAEVIDTRDPYVLGHSQKVADLATQIASKMGLHEKQVRLIYNASLLHDIGKLGISKEILSKPSKLSPKEFEIIRTHPALGATILQKSPHLRPLIPAVRHHHEHYNGEGYPDKLARNQIAIEARIISVADAIEAMSTNRPYRKARSKQGIIDELKKHAGSQFDPLVVEVAINLLAGDERQEFSELTFEKAETKFQMSTTGTQSI
jgi:diguanylate cyclase (GGDEF)-like protein/putative nucleotidyltransferase with HDIG domain